MNEQPPPLPSTGDIWAEIIAELPENHILRPLAIQRRALGIERYGVPLQRGNGRDMARDALEEALDLIAYLRGMRETPDGPPVAMESTALLVARDLAEIQARTTK